MPEPRPRAALALAPSRPDPEPAGEPALVGVVVDAATARKLARDEAFRASPDGAMMRAIMGGGAQ